MKKIVIEKNDFYVFKELKENQKDISWYMKII